MRYHFVIITTKKDMIFLISRGLRHRNLTAMRAATQRGLAALQATDRSGNAGPLAEPARARRAPLTIQGFRSNPAGVYF